MYWKYLKYVIKHKWYVGKECFKCGLYWRGIVHDLSKFLPSEFIPYARYFYGDKNMKTSKDFDFAWLLHQKRNDHHWQWWYLVMDEDKNVCIQMTDDALIEMICDWRGVGKALTGKDNSLKWYKEKHDRMLLNCVTRMNAEYILGCTEWDKKYFIKREDGNE